MGALSLPGDFGGWRKFASFSAFGLCPARMSNFSNFCFTSSANPENCFSSLATFGWLKCAFYYYIYLLTLSMFFFGGF